MRKFIGIVKNISGDKTLSVEVERKCTHKIYGKVLTRRKRYPVHDERNFFKAGDLVRFTLSRPFSKTKFCSVLYGDDVVK